jgi:hypothetical protein
VKTLETNSEVECSCYGCAIERQRAGITEPDRSSQPCNPLDACSTHGRCWTHSKWIDEAACDPPSACVLLLGCSAHDEVKS